MNNLIIGACIYNEEKKFLKSFLDNISLLSKKIVIVDDGSTDNSLSICSNYTSYIFQTNRLYAEDESKLRQFWWEKAIAIAEDGDFICPMDADTFYTNNSIIHYEEELYNCIKEGGDAIAGHQYDMWNEKEYREEPEFHWYANLVPWVTCVRYKKNYNYYWYNMKIHGGSIPMNSYFSAYPCKVQAKHLAYSTPELRKEKVIFYDKYDPNDILNNGRIRYLHIMDENPRLLPFIDLYEESSL